MKPLSRDTHPDAARVQIERLRALGPDRRFELVRSLSRTAMFLARRALREAHPEASEEELAVLFVELHYGKGLAKGLRQHDARNRG